MAPGETGLLLVEHWPELEADRQQLADVLTGIMTEAGSADPLSASGVIVDRQTLAIALVDAQGGLKAADVRFRECIGDPTLDPDLMRLIRDAGATGSRVGVVLGRDGGPGCVCAIAGKALARWRAPLLSSFGSEGEPPRGGAALVAFAPSSTTDAVSLAGEAYGFSALERRVVNMLVEQPTLKAAAKLLGISRSTAKAAQASAMRKAGVDSAVELLDRLIRLSSLPHGPPSRADEDLAPMLGLTRAETRVARVLASGSSARKTADRLGVSEQTVAAHRRSIFAKIGVGKARQLARLITDVESMARLSGAGEVSELHGRDPGRLRFLIDADRRRVAFLDYGPASGDPVVLGHGALTGRIPPPPLLTALHADGRRVVALTRPGFGLTSPALHGYAETVVADFRLLLDNLRAPACTLVTRDSISALAILAACPSRVSRVLLVNPQFPNAQRVAAKGPIQAITRMLLEHPQTIDPFARMLVRQSKDSVIGALLQRSTGSSPADRAVTSDAALLDHLVRDVLGLLGPSVIGFSEERRVFASGWSPPSVVETGKLTILLGEDLAYASDGADGSALSCDHVVVVGGAGWFLLFSHPEAVLLQMRRADDGPLPAGHAQKG